jgi:glycosyltransferase involved in cell wall biosynthesis
MINFVTESGRWILGRWCDEWAACIKNSKVGTEPIPGAVNIYVNYALYQKTGKDIAYFTHREKTDEALQKKFDQVAKDCDWCVAQCTNTLKLLPSKKSSIIKPGVGKHFVKKELVLGIPVKKQPFDRKRLSWAEELTTIPGVKVVFAEGDIPYKRMHKWYKKLDYILITSENEGGPMGVLEAIAMCKPFIAPKGVGWVEEYPGIYFDTKEELREIVEGLTYKRDAWEFSSKQIVDLTQNLWPEISNA